MRRSAAHLTLAALLGLSLAGAALAADHASDKTIEFRFKRERPPSDADAKPSDKRETTRLDSGKWTCSLKP